MQISSEIKFHYCVLVQLYPLNPRSPIPLPRSQIPHPRSLRRLALPEAEQGFLTLAGVWLGGPRWCRWARGRQTCPHLGTRGTPGALGRKRGVVVAARGMSLVPLEACLYGPLAVYRDASRSHRAVLLSSVSLSSRDC
jgi:hypothetical protein